MLKVNRRQCASCIFGKSSPIDENRFAELERDWEMQDVHQICHKSYVGDGDDEDYDSSDKVVCRGYYNAVVRGEYSPSQLLRIAGRLNAIVFVNVPDEEELNE